MMALSVPNPPTTPRRVKVYELRNNDWFDRGTGYCTGQLVNVRKIIILGLSFVGVKLMELLAGSAPVPIFQSLGLFRFSFFCYSHGWDVVILPGYRWLMLVARCVVG